LSAEALLAVLGLALAVYAVLPMEKRLDLRLRLGTPEWVLIGIAFFLVHCIKFYPGLRSLGVVPDFGSWRWGFDADSGSYLIVAVTVAFVWVRSRRPHLTRRGLPLSAYPRLLSNVDSPICCIFLTGI
jgi:hypothetical protein